MKHTPSKGMQAAAKRGVEMAKKPEISNNDIPDVSLKGGKKIASGQQISDEHVRSMAQYHAAHMGDCPSGDDPEGCDDLLWGGPAGAGWAASRVAAMDATTLSSDTGPDLAQLLTSEDQFSIELYTRPDLVLDGKLDLKRGDDGLIWAPILRSGTLACRPDPTAPNGRKNEPLTFVKGHAVGPKEIGLQDLFDAFEANAVQHVTIPKTHRNDEFENTGFIRKLKIADSTLRPGEQVLVAGHEFLDADAEQRVEAGLIANRSCGILHGYQNTETGTVYPHVIEHVALTNKPWVTGMEAYGSDAFSDGRQIVPLMLSDGQAFPIEAPDPQRLPKSIFSTATDLEVLERELFADVAWDDKDGEPSLTMIQRGLYQALGGMGRSPYYDEDSVHFDVRDVRPTSALVTVDYGGRSSDDDTFVVPFTWQDGKLTLADHSQWKVVKQAYIADDDANTDKDETQQLMQQEPGTSLEDARAIIATYLDVPAAQRKKARSDGDTMPDGTYPITTQTQANNAWNLRNNSKKFGEAAIVAHIKRQVAKYKLTMPGAKKTDAALPDLPTDPLKRASMLRLSQEQTPATPGGTMTITPELLASLNLSPEATEVLQRQMTEDQRRDAELARYRATDKESGRATRLTRAKEIFGEAATGTLAVIDELLLADDADVAVTLLADDDGTGMKKKVNLTVSQVIDRLFATFPTGEAAKTALAQKTSLLENPLSGRPDLKPNPAEVGPKAEETGDQLLERWQSALPGGLDLAISTRQPATAAPAPTPAQ